MPGSAAMTQTTAVVLDEDDDDAVQIEESPVPQEVVQVQEIEKTADEVVRDVVTDMMNRICGPEVSKNVHESMEVDGDAEIEVIDDDLAVVGEAKSLTSQEKEKEHQCTLCSREFLRKKTLEKHMAEHANDCGETIADVFGIPRGKVVYVCRLCCLAYEDREVYVRHRRKHGHVYSCSLCSAVSCHLNQMQAHYVKHDAKCSQDRLLFACSTCSVGFHSNESFSYHMNMTHQQDLIFFCKNCGYGHTSADSLLRHISESCSQDNLQSTVGVCMASIFHYQPKNVKEFRKFVEESPESSVTPSECIHRSFIGAAECMVSCPECSLAMKYSDFFHHGYKLQTIEISPEDNEECRYYFINKFATDPSLRVAMRIKSTTKAGIREDLKGAVENVDECGKSWSSHSEDRVSRPTDAANRQSYSTTEESFPIFQLRPGSLTPQRKRQQQQRSWRLGTSLQTTAVLRPSPMPVTSVPRGGRAYRGRMNVPPGPVVYQHNPYDVIHNQQARLAAQSRSLYNATGRRGGAGGLMVQRGISRAAVPPRYQASTSRQNDIQRSTSALTPMPVTSVLTPRGGRAYRGRMNVPPAPVVYRHNPYDVIHNQQARWAPQSRSLYNTTGRRGGARELMVQRGISRAALPPRYQIASTSRQDYRQRSTSALTVSGITLYTDAVTAHSVLGFLNIIRDRTSNYQFLCVLCGTAHSTRQHALNHQNTKHLSERNLSETVEAFFCKVCLTQFNTRSQFLVHFNDNHLTGIDVTRNSCNPCSRIERNPSDHAERRHLITGLYSISTEDEDSPREDGPHHKEEQHLAQSPRSKGNQLLRAVEPRSLKRKAGSSNEVAGKSEPAPVRPRNETENARGQQAGGQLNAPGFRNHQRDHNGLAQRQVEERRPDSACQSVAKQHPHHES